MGDIKRFFMEYNTLGKLFIERCRISSNKNSFGIINQKDKLKFISYEQYRIKVLSLSQKLRQLNIQKQDKVAILGHNSFFWHLSDMATIVCGAISVPIYPTYLGDTIEYIFNESGCKYLFIDEDEFVNKVAPITSKLKNLKHIIILKKSKTLTAQPFSSISYTEDVFKNEISQEQSEEIKQDLLKQSGDDIASIIYTSGTTGTPLGAVIKHKAFCAMLNNVKKSMNNTFCENDRTFSLLPFSHVFGRMESFLPLIFGWEMVFMRKLETVLSDIQISKPTIMLAVPRIFEKIYAKVNELISQSALKKKIFSWSAAVTNHYLSLKEQGSPIPFWVTLKKNIAFTVVLKKNIQPIWRQD